MSGHPNATIVRDALDAFMAGDDDRLGAAFTQDVVWHVPGVNRFAGRFDGRDAVMDRLRRMAEAGLTFTFDVHDVVANDEHAVALVHVHVRNAAGQRYDQQQVQVWHLRDGRCHEYWAMNEDQAVLDLLIG
jgi:ketosteroid isomerase-like protein